MAVRSDASAGRYRSPLFLGEAADVLNQTHYRLQYWLDLPRGEIGDHVCVDFFPAVSHFTHVRR